jgi:opacity protein-like surface antigen
MKHRCIVAALAAALILSASVDLSAQQEPPVTQGIREAKPNLVGGEIGGRAVLYSLTYERFVTPRVGLGVGLMGFGTSEGAIGLFPVHVSFVPVGDVHSLYLSGGATFAVGTDNWDEVESAWYGTVTIGYLYHSIGGFFVRPSINLLFGSGDFLFLPGIQIGGSF